MSETEPSMNPTEGLGNFYDYLWGAEQGWVYLPTKNPQTDEWHKTLFEWPKHRAHVIKHTLANTAEGKEVYVAPAMFTEPMPLKENVKGSNFLWVDFDGNAPSRWTPEGSDAAHDPPRAPQPSLRVCSSREGHEHVYWKLDKFTTDIDFIEDKNRALAYSLKADTSGWDVGQVLRPPFTTNYKHDLPVAIKAAKNVSYSAESFKDFENVKQLVSQSIEIDEIPEVTWVVAQYEWNKEHFELFMKPSIEEGKRSSALMKLGYFGAESGMTDGEIYSLLLNADDRWGKFKKRSDRQKRLLDIINKARQKHPVGLKSQEGILRGLLGDESNVEESPKYVFGFDEFNKTEVQIEWVIDGLLERGGMGVLVSGPGVGKTQLSLQFAISCALGLDFLKWQVLSPMKILWFSLEMNHAALKHFTSQFAVEYNETQLQILDRNLKIVPLGETLPLDHPDGRKFMDALIEEYKPDGIVIDSMGKVTNSSLVDEERIKTLNSYYVATRKKHGLFLWFIHHNRKANADNKKPTQLDDVYGNQYIAAETSVALGLWRDKKNGEVSKDIEVTTLKNRLSEELSPFVIRRRNNLHFELINPTPRFDGLVSEVNNDTDVTATNGDDATSPVSPPEEPGRGVFNF